MKIPKRAFNWHCERCNTVNPLTCEKCKQCGAKCAEWADWFQLHDKLTPEEERYYKGTAPYILSELRQIKELLEEFLHPTVALSDSSKEGHEK